VAQPGMAIEACPAELERAKTCWLIGDQR